MLRSGAKRLTWRLFSVHPGLAASRQVPASRATTGANASMERWATLM
jgi:hypothetical protein